jgi:hypothetical protein
MLGMDGMMEVGEAMADATDEEGNIKNLKMVATVGGIISKPFFHLFLTEFKDL